MTLYLSDIIYTSKFIPEQIVKICPDTKRCYSLPFDGVYGDRFFIKQGQTWDDVLFSNKVNLVDINEIILIRAEKDFIYFWSFIYIFTFFIETKILKNYKFTTKTLAGQPLPYLHQYMSIKYAELRKHQYFTQLAKEYLKGKKDLLNFYKKNKQNFIDNQSWTLNKMVQTFGNQYSLDELQRVIKHYKYLTK